MTADLDEPIEAEVVGQLIERPAHLGVLAMKGPGEVLEKASEVATALVKIIDDKRLFVAIKGKRFVMCEGWTTLGAMLGVAIKELQTVESEATPGEFVSTVEAIRTSDGLVVGRASASCGPDERDWSSRSRQARRSMAQTRAAGKAMRLLFSWVMNLAGYAVTPWEEIEGELMPQEHSNPMHDSSAPHVQPRSQRMDAKTIAHEAARWKALQHPDDATPEGWAKWVLKTTNCNFDPTKASQWTAAHLMLVRQALDREEGK